MTPKKRKTRGRRTHFLKERAPRPPGRHIYIGLRRWDSAQKRTISIKGSSINAYDFTSDEVKAIIVLALQQAAEDFQAATQNRTPRQLDRVTRLVQEFT